MPTKYNFAALAEYSLLSTRNGRLPTLYTLDDHPLHPDTNPGRSFIVILRPTIAAMEEMEQFEVSLEIPQGRKEELDSQGLLELEPGDYLFGRNEFGSGRAEDDVVFAWSVGASLQPESYRIALDQATQSALGPKASRTRSTVNIDRYFKPVKPGTRCFNVATSLERQPIIVAPTAQLKEDANQEAVREIASELASAVAPMAMLNMAQAPLCIQEPIRRRTDMLGLPRIGSVNNWAYQALQCNVAAVPENSSGDLSEQMGFFGGAHFDAGDSAAHYTNMITNSQLPEGYDNGYFHLLAFGVYVRLSNYAGFNFQGNRKHGGTGPFPPAGEVPPPHAYRFNLISYPPANMMNPTQTRWRLATNPGVPAFLTPEMRDPVYRPPCTSKTGNESATFFKHGYIYMDRRSQAEFYSRSLYDMCRYYVNQVPADVGLVLDPDIFLSAFEYRDKQGVLGSVPAWPTAPRVAVDEPKATEIKEEYEKGRKMWDDHYKKVASLIPTHFLRSEELRIAASMGRGRADIEPGASSIEEAAEAPEGSYTGSADAVAGSSPRKRKLPSALADEQSKRTSGTSKKARMLPRIVQPAKETASPSSSGPSNEEANLTSDVSGNGSGKGSGNGKGKGKGSGNAKGKGNGKGKARAEDEGVEMENVEAGTKKGARGSKSKAKNNAGASTSDTDIGSAFTFAFTKETTSEILEKELGQLVREVQTEETLEYVPPLDEVLEFVHAQKELVECYPDAQTAAQDVDNLVKSIGAIESIMDLQNLSKRQTRLAVVTARTMVWTWLMDALPGLVNEELSRQRQGVADSLGDKRWLPRLVVSLKEVLQGQQEDFTFHSHLFAFHPPGSTVAFEFHNTMARRILVGDELDDAVSRTLSDVVAGWLCFEKDINMKLAWFVSSLRDQIGIEIVTMDHVWNMVRNFKSTYVASGTHPHRTTDPSSSLAFKEELSRHPITQDGTREHELFCQYQRLYLGDISPSEVTLARHTGVGWAQYVRMWRTSLAYVESPSSPPQDAYHSKLCSLPDCYLPIREKAPCRVRAKGVGGMYDPEVIKTLPGIFSAVVFRAVTYRSPFFLNHRMVFDSWDDLTTTIDDILLGDDYIGMKRDDEYFGLMGPYGGRPNPDRSIELCKTYYESLEERRWPQFSSTTPRPTFERTLQYFTPKRGEKGIFPQLGDLARMSLVCDLAYASACDMPSIGDMALCMVTLKSGGLRGLRVLGLLDEFPKRMPTPKKTQLVADALQEVMDFMEVKFNVKEREVMGLDFIVLEHSLCKLSRAKNDL